MINNFPFWLFLGAFFAGLGIWFLEKKRSVPLLLLSLSFFFILLFTGLVLGDVSPGIWPLYLAWWAGLTGYFYLVFRWPLAAVWPGFALMAVCLVFYSNPMLGLPASDIKQEIRLVCLPSEQGRMALRVERPGQEPDLIILEGKKIHPLYIRVHAHPFLFWKKSRTTWLAGFASEPAFVPGISDESSTAWLFPEFRGLAGKNIFKLPGLTVSYPTEEILHPGDYFSFTLIPGGDEPVVLHR
jgi:hypothetical protein